MDSGSGPLPPADRRYSRKAAIVGIGETDYDLDYQAARAKPPGYEAPTPDSLSILAFERALADSGLDRSEIDGISVSFTYGGPDPESLAATLGLNTRYAIRNGHIMAGPLPTVCADIADGKADTVAMIYAVASRSIGRQYGGATYSGSESTPKSYYYFHPWGWSSQAAHWAMIFSRYQAEFGATEEDLGAVAMQLRRNAIMTPHAVMQAPMSLEDYMRSRYIVRPMHLFDMCLVNDGAVCLIVRRADLAKGLAHAPVLVSGWGGAAVKADKLRAMVYDRLRPIMQAAGAEALQMAGLELGAVDHFECYDPASIHIVNQLEGYGFVEPGQGLEAFKSGYAAPGGRLPTNTGGGMMSGAYMQGWSHVAEVVRQLRHEAGPRQAKDARVSMSSLAQTDAAHPIVYERGE